jgi:hypothetical protein
MTEPDPRGRVGSLGRGEGDDDSERGERQLRDSEETVEAAARADRLERNSTSARDSTGVQTGAGKDAGRDADVAHGESGDANNP